MGEKLSSGNNGRGEMIGTILSPAAATYQLSTTTSTSSKSTSMTAHQNNNNSTTTTSLFKTGDGRNHITTTNGTCCNAANSNLLTKFFNFSPEESTIKRKQFLRLPDGRAITYGEFEHTVFRYADYLQSAYAIGKGDRVAAQVSKSPETLALYLATLSRGAVYVPLNTDYKRDEIDYFLGNSEPTLFVCRPGDLEIYRSAYGKDWSCTIVDEKQLAENVKRNANKGNNHQRILTIENVEKDDLAAILYTSGTTGRPKGAMITHGNLSANAEVLCAHWRITRNDVLLHAMPIYHAHGLFVAVNTILLVGASIIFLPRFELDSVLDSFKYATLMMGVPTYYTRLLSSEKFDKRLVEHMRLFVAGSAPLLESTWREFKTRTGGKEILERYGMTEGQMVCSNPYEGSRKPGTVGPALPGISVRIRNGRLEYKGPNLFKGYWRMPEKTREDFTEDGYFVSGDLAECDEEGYVRIMGRSKDLIITGGLNVYPKEVENAVDSLPGVSESAVIGVEHPDFGEAVIAVVSRNNQQQMQEQEMVAALKEKIAAFKVPKRIFFQEQLPKNVMGKVQKNVLRDKYRDVFSKNK